MKSASRTSVNTGFFYLTVLLLLMLPDTDAIGQSPKVITVVPEDFLLVHSYEGRLEPLERVTVRSETSGTIEKTNFEEGQIVRENQVLVNVSTERLTFQEKLAQSNFQLAEYEYLAQKQLFDQNVTTASVLNSYINKRDVNKIQLELARLDLEKSKVKSPITGIVKSKSVQTGETVNAHQNLLEIMNMSKVLAEIKIPENDIIFVYLNKPVTVRLTSLPGQTFKGRIKTLGLEVDAQTKQFPAEIIIDNSNNQLFPGMTANVEMITVSMKNQILIPHSALRTKGSTSQVFIVGNGIATLKNVTTGTYLKDRVQILSGLKAGDNLMAAPSAGLKSGTRITQK